MIFLVIKDGRTRLQTRAATFIRRARRPARTYTFDVGDALAIAKSAAMLAQRLQHPRRIVATRLERCVHFALHERRRRAQKDERRRQRNRVNEIAGRRVSGDRHLYTGGVDDNRACACLFAIAASERYDGSNRTAGVRF